MCLAIKNAEIIYKNGNRYVGGVVDGKRQGQGKIITPAGGIQQDGTWYEDDWIDKMRIIHLRFHYNTMALV